MKKGIIVGVIIVLVLGALFILPRYSGSRDLDGFAQCITDSKATFYGAWWCDHCRNQKAMFSASADKLPYVECSGSNPSGPMNDVCTQAGVEGYPTWVFADGSKLSGEVPLDVLATKTGCQLPQES